MKRLTFNSTLNHKQNDYNTYEIEVEKIVMLYGKQFDDLKNHTLAENPWIDENRDLMYVDDNHVAHCILFIDNNTGDGIIAEAEGFNYARKSQFIPNARAIVEQNDMTPAEQQLHRELKEVADKIAELAHAGDKYFVFEDVLGDTNIRALMVRSVAEILSRRTDLAEVKDHYLDIPGQADFTVTPKPTQEMKFYSPLTIQAEPQFYETDWDDIYDGDYEIIPSSCAKDCEDEINEAIQEYSEENEAHRGLMVYYDDDSPVNEKIYSAFPSVEVRGDELVGVLTCKVAEPLTENEMAEFKEWWAGQASDGWGEGYEQQEIKTESLGKIYVSFWNSSDSWQIETGMMDESEDIGEEESLDMTM